MHQPPLPDNVSKIDRDDQFSFACHPGISCFTHCCRQLDLALTPYDVLRLKHALGLCSSDFLEKYVLIEQEESEAFPRLYLTMVDDGKASCVFVAAEGCTVYQDRPGACRAYPIGRAAAIRKGSPVKEFFVLLKENHCRGFNSQSPRQTPLKYCQNQGLAPYNRFNDAVGDILQHEMIRKGMKPTKEQIKSYLLALYDIDTLREIILDGRLPHASLTPSRQREIADDETLLLFAIGWLKSELFPQHHETTDQ